MSARTKELSWSLSKARMFHECARRYYYHYHLSEDGYFLEAHEDARLALEMKTIKGLDMWVGEVVHETIQWVLEQVKLGASPGIDQARSEARRMLSDGWRGSVTKLWRTHPKDGIPNLFDHYYGVPHSAAVTDRLKTKAFLSVTNFMESDLFRDISSTRADHWLPIEKYASFRLDGILFYVKFDFALRRPGGQLVVYDWKTGNPSADENRQLACYAIYTAQKWDVPIEMVRVTAAHLQPLFDAPERDLDESEIEDMRSYARSTFSSMVKCLRDPVRRVAVMGDFSMTGNLLRCTRCNFRGICEQGRIASGELDEELESGIWE